MTFPSAGTFPSSSVPVVDDGPLITPNDLGIYLNDNSINQERAAAMIADSQTLCETIVSPLPSQAAVIVKRVAARGYVSTTSSRQSQVAAAGSPFGGAPGGLGGVWLSRSDKADLRRFAGGGGAFSIDMLPVGYAAPSSWNTDDPLSGTLT